MQAVSSRFAALPIGAVDWRIELPNVRISFSLSETNVYALACAVALHLLQNAFRVA
ncbi:MAG: hypothetical protein BWX88_01821 [Planctomycetes bacterium ADurb.Bin126]|nr:MAG: hypothetical protein BWX88_01821 [Planctomycetes bacterium ADurb.Bin126]